MHSENKTYKTHTIYYNPKIKCYSHLVSCVENICKSVHLSFDKKIIQQRNAREVIAPSIIRLIYHWNEAVVSASESASEYKLLHYAGSVTRKRTSKKLLLGRRVKDQARRRMIERLRFNPREVSNGRRNTIIIFPFPSPAAIKRSEGAENLKKLDVRILEGKQVETKTERPNGKKFLLPDSHSNFSFIEGKHSARGGYRTKKD